MKDLTLSDLRARVEAKLAEMRKAGIARILPSLAPNADSRAANQEVHDLFTEILRRTGVYVF